MNRNAALRWGNGFRGFRASCKLIIFDFYKLEPQSALALAAKLLAISPSKIAKSCTPLGSLLVFAINTHIVAHESEHIETENTAAEDAIAHVERRVAVDSRELLKEKEVSGEYGLSICGSGRCAGSAAGHHSSSSGRWSGIAVRTLNLTSRLTWLALRN